MSDLFGSVLDQVSLITLVDIGITALLIYWLFSLIRGTRAVRLVIGVSVLIVVYVLAEGLGLQLLTRILQGGAVVGLFALVVIFQPEIRRGLDRIGRVGSFAWLLSPADSRIVDHVADEVARAAADLSTEGHGALIVLERETGLEEVAETGVMIHGDVSADLIRTIFAPRTALHDGAIIIRGDTILAAGALLPLAESTVQPERFGTRHRAALGIAEQTDAVVVVVSEENGQISLVDRSRIVRNLNEGQLARAIRNLLDPNHGRRRGRSACGQGFGGHLHVGRTGAAVTRVLGVIVHNWPLKLAAVGLATLLYGGLVLSQSTQTLSGIVPVTVEGQPDDTFLLTAVEPVTAIRYFAPSGVQPIATTFIATIDVSDVTPGGGPQLVPIIVTSLDDRITVLGSQPDVMTVELDALETRTVPVVVDRGTVPDGLELGETTVDPSEVEVSGPASVIDLVVGARADVVIQSGGIDIDQDVRLVPVDQLGSAVSPVDVEPATARVQIPVFTDRETRTLPVGPVITGTPAAGFEIASVTVEPSVVTVEGDADDLVALEQVDTAPVSVNGISADTTVTVELATPDGVTPLDRATVDVTITLRPVTATRSFEVGVRLVGNDADLRYAVAVDRVLITVGGSIADLDRLEGGSLVADLDVSGLGVGTSDVDVTADLPAGVILVSASPSSVSVTITAAPEALATPTPGATTTPTPTASPGG